jgi:hypothetical protein
MEAVDRMLNEVLQMLYFLQFTSFDTILHFSNLLNRVELRRIRRGVYRYIFAKSNKKNCFLKTLLKFAVV